MLREGTAVPAVWFSIELIFGLFALKNGGSLGGIRRLLQNPVIVIINLITLAAALLHTKTWFELAPKAANIIVKTKNGTRANYQKSLGGNCGCHHRNPVCCPVLVRSLR